MFKKGQLLSERGPIDHGIVEGQWKTGAGPGAVELVVIAHPFPSESRGLVDEKKKKKTKKNQNSWAVPGLEDMC